MTDSPKCPGCHSSVLCCINTCPHPSPIPAVPKEHLVPSSIFLGEKQVNIINGVCSTYQQFWNIFFCQDTHRLSNTEYLHNKARPHLARFDLRFRCIQGYQFLCRVLVGAVFLPSSH